MFGFLHCGEGVVGVFASISLLYYAFKLLLLLYLFLPYTRGGCLVHDVFIRRVLAFFTAGGKLRFLRARLNARRRDQPAGSGGTAATAPAAVQQGNKVKGD